LHRCHNHGNNRHNQQHGYNKRLISWIHTTSVIIAFNIIPTGASQE
jgi:hypothetical protein